MVVPAESHTSGIPDVFAAFESVARRHHNLPALIACGGRGRVYSYGEVLTLARQVAVGLGCEEYAGIDQIGILSENRPEWGIAYLSILAAGRTVVPIDPNLEPGEIEFITNDAGLGIVFTSGRLEKLAASLHPGLVVLSFEEGSDVSWLKLTGSESGLDPVRRMKTAVLIYTSGTTGFPKAVELTHRNLLSNIEGIRGALSFGHTDTFLSVLPLHHTFEATCGFLVPLLSGARIVYARSLKSREIIEDIAVNRVTLMCGVPLLFEKMYHLPL